MVCLEHKELHKHRQHSWAFEGISGGCGAFPHQHPSCSTQLNLKKQLSPQAKLYPRRSSIISLRITELRQDLLSEVGEKSYWGRCQETAPSIISAPQKKKPLQSKPGCSRALPWSRYSTSRTYRNVRSYGGITLKSHRIY